MELKQLWAVVQRRWWLIALPAIIALVITIPALRGMFTSTSGYNVTIRFTAGQPPTGGSFEEQSYISWLGSEYAVINLAQWMRTETFAREISAALKAAGKGEFAVGDLRASLISDSVRSIMTLSINWPDASQIEDIANAAITALREKAPTYFPQLSAVKAEVIALDGIVVNPVATPLTARISPLIRIAIGLIAGIGLAFLAEYLDQTLRTRREVETALDLPVIVEIPRS